MRFYHQTVGRINLYYTQVTACFMGTGANKAVKNCRIGAINFLNYLKIGASYAIIRI